MSLRKRLQGCPRRGRAPGLLLRIRIVRGLRLATIGREGGRSTAENLRQ